jgi:hypothetical protein
MRTILEISGDTVAVSAIEPVSDTTEVVVKSRILGTLEASELVKSHEVALAAAKSKGWQAAGEWGDGDMDWISLEPAPVRVPFVGGELPNDEAIRYAVGAGIQAQSVIKQETVIEEGRNYVTFAVKEPMSWRWNDAPV